MTPPAENNPASRREVSWAGCSSRCWRMRRCGRNTQGDDDGRLITETDELHKIAAAARSIKLAKLNPLPSPQQQLAPFNQHRHADAHQRSLHMTVAVPFPMLVVRLAL